MSDVTARSDCDPVELEVRELDNTESRGRIIQDFGGREEESQQIDTELCDVKREHRELVVDEIDGALIGVKQNRDNINLAVENFDVSKLDVKPEGIAEKDLNQKYLDNADGNKELTEINLAPINNDNSENQINFTPINNEGQFTNKENVELSALNGNQGDENKGLNPNNNKEAEIKITPNNNRVIENRGTEENRNKIPSLVDQAVEIDFNSNKEETADSVHEKELNELKSRHSKAIEEYEDKIKLLEWSLCKSQKLQKETETRLEAAVKQKESATKEKESMVMRYAVREKNLIKQQSACEQLEKKLKENSRELDLLQHKLTSMTAEKSRICQMLDNKCYELKTNQQELERVKNDLSSLETKLKWSQNSLKTEMELRKEAENKVDSLNSQIQEYVDAAEKAKKDAASAVREFYTSQENRAHVLDQQLKELQASLIMLKHERDDREQQGKALQSELERLQRKQSETLQENNMLSMKVQQLEKERSEQELKLSEFRDFADQQRQDVADLHSRTTQLEQMKLQLKNEQEQVIAMNEQISALKQRNSDLLSDMESCRIHEAELLSFTHQLTDKNVRLQSEFTAMETRVQQLTCEQAVLKRAAKEQETKAALASSQLMELKSRKNDEGEKMLKELEEKSVLCERLSQEVADHKGEYNVMKRKLELSLREAHKELVQCRKKLEQYERGEGTTSSSSSSTSLNTVEQRSHHSPVSTPDQVQVVQPERELDRQALIEHIVKLQRASARKSEKLDFLEEHVNTLVAELQKKSRLLQSYILREQAGTLSSNTMDNNKANLAKYSGVMASMYGSKVVDGNLTLELSLDINRKLQAVLEDALLKNITLKENVDTLGAEIDRLLKKPQE